MLEIIVLSSKGRQRSLTVSLTVSSLVQKTPSFTCVLETPGRQLSIETFPASVESHRSACSYEWLQ